MRRRWARWLFVVPAVCAIWTPLYARTTPKLGPFPFVLWFQFATVLMGSVVTAVVYLIEHHHAPEPDGALEGGGAPEGGRTP